MASENIAHKRPSLHTLETATHAPPVHDISTSVFLFLTSFEKQKEHNNEDQTDERTNVGYNSRPVKTKVAGQNSCVLRGKDPDHEKLHIESVSLPERIIGHEIECSCKDKEGSNNIGHVISTVQLAQKHVDRDHIAGSQKDEPYSSHCLQDLIRSDTENTCKWRTDRLSSDSRWFPQFQWPESVVMAAAA